MLTLTLFRHAKSSWDESTLDDFERPLAPRGLKAAPRMGRALAKLGPSVDLVLCSTAKRTRQTLELVLPELAPNEPPVHFDEALYHGLPEILLERTLKHAGSARHVMLVGHNPGLEILAARLVDDGDDEELRDMAYKFPTAAFAQFTFDIDAWADLEIASGHLTAFRTPRSLT